MFLRQMSWRQKPVLAKLATHKYEDSRGHGDGASWPQGNGYSQASWVLAARWMPSASRGNCFNSAFHGLKAEPEERQPCRNAPGSGEIFMTNRVRTYRRRLPGPRRRFFST